MTFAGAELGGTKCVAILARGPGEVLARETVPTTTPDETLRALERILLGWQESEGFDALGIASFGPIDLHPDSPSWGHVVTTTKPGWSGADIAPRLAQCLGVPVAFETDVNGAAIAEMRWGAGQRMRDFAYITVGTGVGVGLVVNGQPTRGFLHSELGHVRVAQRAGDEWSGICPFHGACVEGLASGPAIMARIAPRDIDEVGAGDPVWDSVAWALAQLCHVIVCAAAPGAIAIGGGVMERQPHLLGRIERLLVQSLSDYMPLPRDEGYVVPPALGRDAGPLGAIALAMTARP
ncbi:MAG TPA: ROK family protein [Sphingomicrobium sp.]|nr:ROK family protein [Sphingomicrobium sp.]